MLFMFFRERWWLTQRPPKFPLPPPAPRSRRIPAIIPINHHPKSNAAEEDPTHPLEGWEKKKEEIWRILCILSPQIWDL